MTLTKRRKRCPHCQSLNTAEGVIRTAEHDGQPEKLDWIWVCDDCDGSWSLDKTSELYVAPATKRDDAANRLDLHGTSEAHPAAAGYVSHFELNGRPLCGTRMLTFWSGCWSHRPTCRKCQGLSVRRVAASSVSAVARAVAAEREECARICDMFIGGYSHAVVEDVLVPDRDGPWCLNSDLARAIRARGKAPAVTAAKRAECPSCRGSGLSAAGDRSCNNCGGFGWARPTETQPTEAAT